MRTLDPAVFVAIILAGIGAQLSAWSAESPGRQRARPTAAPCPSLTFEDHGRSFAIEKPPCKDGGMTIPMQEVVPTVSPQRAAPSSDAHARRSWKPPVDKEQQRGSR